MLSKFSSEALFSAQHLDANLLPPGHFQGSESPEKILQIRDRVINVLRQGQSFKHLEQPLQKLFPEPIKYGNDHAEKRTLEEDTEKRNEEADQACALVNVIFKSGSAAHAVIR
jgi:hypothetical protein